MTSPSISGPRQGGAPGASAALAAVVALAVGVAGGRASHGPDPMVPAGPGDYGQGSPPEEPDRGRRGWEGDGWADVVVGQPDFTEVTPFDVVAFKLFNPGGVAVDTRAGREHLYVWDSGNSRVVGVDLAACHAVGAPCRAAVILGQPSGRDRSACNGDSGFTAFPVRRAAGAGTLCGIPEDTVSVLEAKSGVTMAVDDRGRLFVPDFFNNRLLMYEDPFATDAIADAVWGQADFTGNQCNRGAGTAPESLCFASPYAAGAATALDGAGNLWVADGGNNRVLRYPARPNGGPPAPSADLVLGQADLAASRASPGLGGLDSPSGLAFDASGRLFVADTGHDRVLEYAPPFVSGMAAHGVVGRQLRRPGAVARDPAGSGVWISDPGNGMIERWDLDSPSATAVVGRAEYQPDGQCPGSVCPFTGGFAFDARGRLLVSAYGHKQDVLAFDVPAEGGAAAEPVAQLFSPPEGYNFADPRRPRGLGAIGGLAVGADQLVVGDGRRLVFWNDLEGLASGQAADGLVAAEAFSSPEAWQGRMAVDVAGRLWSLRAEGVDLFAMPLTAASRPLARIMPAGQAIAVLGGGELVLGRYRHGLAVVGAGRAVWIADPANHRVVRIRHPVEAPVVDVVLGQLGPGPGTCNRGLEAPPNLTGREVLRTDVLCYPGAVSVDQGGNVYVSDHTVEAEGNWRMLVFLAATVPEGLKEPIYAPKADRVFPYRTLQPGATFEAAFDSGNRMAVGYNAYLAGRYRYGRFIGIYFDPLDPRSLPDAHLRDLMSLPWTLGFDAHDNLFVADTNRHRVLVYWRPLGPFRRHPVAKALLPWATADGIARRGDRRDF